MPNKSDNLPIWNFFERSTDGNKTAICNYCRRELSFKTTITNLKAHLKQKHAAVYNIFLNLSKLDSTSVPEIARRSSSQTNTEDPEVPVDAPECILVVNSNDPSKLNKGNRKRKKLKEESLTPQRLDDNVVNSRPNEDEFYYFGQCVAAQLRALPIVNALDMQSTIQTLLSAERRKMYQDQPNSTSFSKSSTPQK